MTDHLQGREGDSRMVSSWYGRNRKVKLNALDKALEYAEGKVLDFPLFLLYKKESYA